MPPTRPSQTGTATRYMTRSRAAASIMDQRQLRTTPQRLARMAARTTAAQKPKRKPSQRNSPGNVGTIQVEKRLLSPLSSVNTLVALPIYVAEEGTSPAAHSTVTRLTPPPSRSEPAKYRRKTIARA
ncbi:hypothetical protein DFH09DRAFT_1077475 [Mycena vulgaris]|nr:hypothetical protein DFH09DRAFT_1077475 [Mycena vulgaris]